MKWWNLNRAKPGLLRRCVYVDLGTENTLIHVQGLGLVLNEPSYVAYRTSGHGREIIALGTSAKKMLGRAPENIQIIRPLRDGVIADFDATIGMLKKFVEKAGSAGVLGGQMVISIPCKVNEFERRAVSEVGRLIGMRTTSIVEEAVLAAIGADLPITAPVGSMIVDIGGGTTEIAILSLGGIAYSETLRVGGNEMDSRIIEHFKSHFNFLIGESTAEMLKKQYGYVGPDCDEVIDVKGLDLIASLPKIIYVSKTEIKKAIEPVVKLIVEKIQRALSELPPELSADLFAQGIYLAGGVAQLRGLAERIQTDAKVKVAIAKDPLTAIARGGAKVLDSPALLRTVLQN